MTPTFLAALMLAAPQVGPAFDYEKPFVYNSAGTLKKDDLLFPIVASYFSPQMTRRNFAFGLTDDVTVESSLLLNLVGVTNLRIKMAVVNNPGLIVSLAPELVYAPDFDGQNEDYTILGVSAPVTIKLSRGKFFSITPGYRNAVKGINLMRQAEAEDILRFGVNQPWIDFDYLMVIDDYSAVAMQFHYTVPVGATQLDNGVELQPLTTMTGKMEYLRAVGKSTRVGVAILYNPLWIPQNRVAPEGRPDADFLPQVSVWWRIPLRQKKQPKASAPVQPSAKFRQAGSLDRLRKAPIALPIPQRAVPAPAPAPSAAPPAPAPTPAPAPDPAPAPEPAPQNPDDK